MTQAHDVARSWPRTGLARAIRSLLQRPLFALLGLVVRVKVEGREVLDDVAPPVLLVANHASHLDTPILLLCLPERWRRQLAVAAAADYFFARALPGWLVALLFNAFPFSRQGPARPTIENCARLLEAGWSILLFPEGTRSNTGGMGRFKAGAGLIAVNSGVGVVPVYIGGTFSVLPRGRHLPRRSTCTLRFGRALCFARDTPYSTAISTIEAAVRDLAEGPEENSNSLPTIRLSLSSEPKLVSSH